jgi:hypothetical protein
MVAGGSQENLDSGRFIGQAHLGRKHFRLEEILTENEKRKKAEKKAGKRHFVGKETDHLQYEEEDQEQKEKEHNNDDLNRSIDLDDSVDLGEISNQDNSDKRDNALPQRSSELVTRNSRLVQKASDGVESESDRHSAINEPITDSRPAGMANSDRKHISEIPHRQQHQENKRQQGENQKEVQKEGQKLSWLDESDIRKTHARPHQYCRQTLDQMRFYPGFLKSPRMETDSPSKNSTKSGRGSGGAGSDSGRSNRSNNPSIIAWDEGKQNEAHAINVAAGLARARSVRGKAVEKKFRGSYDCSGGILAWDAAAPEAGPRSHTKSALKPRTVISPSKLGVNDHNDKNSDNGDNNHHARLRSPRSPRDRAYNAHCSAKPGSTPDCAAKITDQEAPSNPKLIMKDKSLIF